MKSILFLTLPSFIVISCSHSDVSVSQGEVEEEREKVHYFDFDEADHYRLGHSVSSLELYGMHSDTASEDDRIFTAIYEGDLPESLADSSSFINNLVRLGYVKTDVPASKIDALNNLFIEKAVDPNDDKAMCMPEYRDILIFRKQGKISALAKVCFGCDFLFTRGTEAETRYFGSFRGFEQLRDLLYTD